MLHTAEEPKRSKLLIIGLAILLASCSDLRDEYHAKKIVSASLKDPDSAIFQNMNGVCGEVNAKNSLGGYNGFERFVVLDSVVYFDDNDEKREFFNRIHGLRCTDRDK